MNSHGPIRRQRSSSLVIDRFERDWRDNPPAEIGDYITNLIGDEEALVNLIATDLEYRWKHGFEGTSESGGRATTVTDQPASRAALPICPLVDDYVRLYPFVGRPDTVLIELIAAEYYARARWGDRPTADLYLRRYERYAAELRRRLAKEEEGIRREQTRLPAGEKFGEYVTLGEIDAGGMGRVYKARHRKTGEIVAVKTVKDYRGSQLDLKMEFRRLRDLTLEHTNLVKLGELVVAEGAPFFTMELVDGKHFVEHVRPGFDSELDEAGVLSPPAASRLRDTLLQLASAVKFLHDSGIVHRDLKPQNVLVAATGRVVVLDFGLAAELDDDASRRSIRVGAGTPVYMSPEQASGQPITPASDWYSVGVMLFESLLGRLPRGTDDIDELRRLAGDVVAGLPDELTSLCIDMLRPDPTQRIVGEEVLRRLHGHLAYESKRTAWVGRDAELAALDDALATVVDSHQPITVLVEGMSGVGKSALVNRFRTEVYNRGSGVVFLRGKCNLFESVAYKGFDHVVGDLCKFLQRRPAEVDRYTPGDVDSLCTVFPDLTEIPAIREHVGRQPLDDDGQELRRNAFSGLRELLRRLARFEKLVIFIDDLQWGDEDTAALFEALTRMPGAPVCLLICAFRSEDADSPCVAAVRHRDLPAAEGRNFVPQHEIKLTTLGNDEAIQLARAVLPPALNSSDDIARRIAQQSCGDPLSIRVMADAIADESSNPTELPTRREAYWRRIRELPSQQRAIMELLAIARRPVRDAALVTAAGLAPDAVQHLRDLNAARLLRFVPPREERQVDTYHDEVRASILEQVSESSIAQGSAQLADALEQTSATDPEFLGNMYLQAGHKTRGGDYLAQAAETAHKALAFHRAVDLYQRAIDALQPGGQRAVDLRQQFADSLAMAGYGHRAADEYRRAAAGASTGQALKLRQKAALRYLTSGHVDEGTKALEDVLTNVRIKLPSRLAGGRVSLVAQRLRLRWRGLQFRASALNELTETQQRLLDVYWTAAAGLSVIDPIRAADFACRNFRLALDVGEPFHLARAATAVTGHTATAGSTARGRVSRLLAKTRQAAHLEGGAYSKAACCVARGVAAHLEGRWLVAVHCCDKAADLLEKHCHDVAWELSMARTFAMWALMYYGDMAELSRRQPDLLRAAEEKDDLFSSLNYGTAIRTYRLLAADQPGEARRWLDAERSQLARWGFFVQHHMHLQAVGFLELYDGDELAAWQHLQPAWKEYSKSALHYVQQVRTNFFFLRARAAVAAATTSPEPSDHLREAQREVRRLMRERVGWATALATAIRAGVAAARGDREQATVLVERAACQFDQAEMHLFAAAARMHSENGDARRQGEEEMMSRGVINPRRMCRALVPGFNRG
jgi:tRNA A-37 threonylcarbamoyl transferase component Bud32/GTPase SAR1 family protein